MEQAYIGSRWFPDVPVFRGTSCQMGRSHQARFCCSKSIDAYLRPGGLTELVSPHPAGRSPGHALFYVVSTFTPAARPGWPLVGRAAITKRTHCLRRRRGVCPHRNSPRDSPAFTPFGARFVAVLSYARVEITRKRIGDRICTELFILWRLRCE
jgi:hypothetical protein